MRSAFKQVSAFYDRHSFPRKRLTEIVNETQFPTQRLHALAKLTLASAVQCREERERGVQRFGLIGMLPIGRLALITEELYELVQAMEARDEIATADALADLAYVVIGTAVALDIPLPEVFDEVHDSNMSKAVGGFKPRGESYRRPDIAGAIERGRNSK